MFIELKNIQKTYSSKSGVTFRALSNVTTGFDSKGLNFLVGASGSGKSTLLNVIGGLDDFDSGDLIIAGRNFKDLKPAEVDSLRNTLMGFVFQEFNLIDTLSVFDNVRLALDMQSANNHDAVMKALDEMGIADKAHNKTKDLSGGQRQRVAIARALVKDPKIILADEPTGALDSTTSEEVMNILKKLSETRLVIVVTHDMDAAMSFGDRIIEMKDGRVYRDVRKRLPGEVVEQSDSELFSETLLCVPEGKTVTEKDVETLNTIIGDSARKTFVSVETDPRKVKAMYPYLREAVDAGAKKEQAEGETTALDEGSFVPFKPKDEPSEEVEFKKSRLPFFRTVRLALNNLNHKKFKLILTIIIAFVAFSLFGIAEAFSTYDMNVAVAETVEKEHISVLSMESSMESSDRISTNDVAAFKERAPFAETFVNYSMNLDCYKISDGALSSVYTFSGFVEGEDISKLAVPVYAGSSSCPDFDSVIISRHAAHKLRTSGALAISSEVDAVGVVVRIGSRNYRISGIYDCDYMAPDADIEEAFKRIYVKPGFMENYAARLTNLDGSYTLDVRKTSGSSEKDQWSGDSGRSVSIVLSSEFSGYDKVVPVTTGKIESDYDIILSRNAISELGLLNNDGSYGDEKERITAALRELNDSAERRLVLRSGGLAVWVNNEFTVTGYYDPNLNNSGDYDSSSTIIINQKLKDAIFSAQAYPNEMFVSFDPTASNSLDVVNAASDCGFNITESFIEDYDMVVSLMDTLKTVFFVIAAIFCLLVILLLNSFISSSIKITRKQIGILRAMGAKKSDTFKIYAVEGFLVSFISLALAVVVLIFAGPLLNSLFSASRGYYFALVTVRWFVYLTIAALAALIAFLSVLLPLRKFNKISPVSAISGKDE